MRKMKYASNDYTKADLPQNRKELFFECFKEQFSVLVRLGIFCGMFLLPWLMTVVMKDGYMMNATQIVKDASMEEIESLYRSVDNMVGIIEGLAFVLFFTLFSGIVQVLRQVIWREPVFFWDDFIRGIKSNWKRFLVVALLIAMPAYLMKWMSVSKAVWVLYGMFGLVILPIAVWIFLQSIYYELSLGQCVKNAIIFYMHAAVNTLVLLIITVSPFYLILGCIRVLMVKYFLLIGVAIVFVVPMSMVWILFANHLFDEILNKEYYPHIYRKGLREEEEEIET